MTEPSTVSLPLTEPSLENGIKYNETDFKTDHLTAVIIDSVTLLLCLVKLVGNGIVLWFLGFHIKRNPFTVYILNLAAADFGCLLCLASLNMLVLFMYSTSLYFLMAISTEQCVLPHLVPMPLPKALVCHCLCPALGSLSCLLTGLEAFACVLNAFANCIMMLTPLSVTNFLIFASIMVLSSLTLFIKGRSSSQQCQPGKLYIVILLTVLFFLLFAVPHRIVTFLQNFDYDLNLITTTFLLASLTAASTQLFTFFVGSYRNRQFRGFAEGKGYTYSVCVDVAHITQRAAYVVPNGK
uniref:G-protein coupled receptors family 1 profile domain-containing protein n=1 Tax=Terrapene triunguis TaxID=2587831 RepID=A0A674IXL6_9SAUR